jgi:hypothetical protein
LSGNPIGCSLRSRLLCCGHGIPASFNSPLPDAYIHILVYNILTHMAAAAAPRIDTFIPCIMSSDQACSSSLPRLPCTAQTSRTSTQRCLVEVLLEEVITQITIKQMPNPDTTRVAIALLPLQRGNSNKQPTIHHTTSSNV